MSDTEEMVVETEEVEPEAELSVLDALKEVSNSTSRHYRRT